MIVALEAGRVTSVPPDWRAAKEVPVEEGSTCTVMVPVKVAGDQIPRDTASSRIPTALLVVEAVEKALMYPKVLWLLSA